MKIFRGHPPSSLAPSSSLFTGDFLPLFFFLSLLPIQSSSLGTDLSTRLFPSSSSSPSSAKHLVSLRYCGSQRVSRVTYSRSFSPSLCPSSISQRSSFFLSPSRLPSLSFTSFPPFFTPRKDGGGPAPLLNEGDLTQPPPAPSSSFSSLPPSLLFSALSSPLLRETFLFSLGGGSGFLLFWRKN